MVLHGLTSEPSKVPPVLLAQLVLKAQPVLSDLPVQLVLTVSMALLVPLALPAHKVNRV